MGQFEESLQNFTRDFAYGGAVRHLADHGYTAEQILKEFKYPLSLDSVQKIIDDHLKSKGASTHQE
ncbi:MAG: hypothetical protein J5842_01880 [Lachnospiraceae bacterium]|nr:hypothetical protein [Lachnospiraceae bacterium]